MNIRIWHNGAMDQWRWTLTDRNLNMESGQRPDLREGLNDIADTIEYLIDKNAELPLYLNHDSIGIGDTHQ